MKMKTRNNLLKAALFLCAIFLFTESFAQSEKRIKVANFVKISVNSGINLHLSQGPQERVMVSAHEEIINNVIVSQAANTITIKYKNGISLSRLLNNKPINVYVVYKDLSNISASGGSNVVNSGTLKAATLNISASGGSDIELNVNAKNLRISTSGGSDVLLKGIAENLIASASGGSDIDAFEFSSNYAQVSASGGSDVNVTVNKGLIASATGGSDVTYKGNATLKNNGSSKSGDVTHIR